MTDKSVLRRLATRAINILRPSESHPIFVGTMAEVDRNRPDELSRLYYNYQGSRMVCKYDHYLPIYSRIFALYRDRPSLRFLEIGVSEGGSLELWRSYFGPSATIFGVDIRPYCARFDDDKAQVRIGSQDDPAFLASVVDEMGGVDIVLDDGSHVGRHQWASFEALFPRLSDDGLYVVEDTHTAYWRTWEGGLRKPGTFIEVAKTLADDVNGWYHSGFAGPQYPVGGVHFYNSIVVIEKQPVRKPFIVDMGTNGQG